MLTLPCPPAAEPPPDRKKKYRVTDRLDGAARGISFLFLEKRFREKRAVHLDGGP